MSSRIRITPVKPSLRLLGFLTVIVLVLLLAVRLSNAGRIDQLTDNVSAFRLAMSATSGNGEAMDEPPLPAPGTTVYGVRARALAHAAALSGRSADAELWLVSGLGESVSAYLTQFQLCRLYWQLGLRDRALQVCQGTVVSADFWLGEGLRVLEQGEGEEALALFELAAFTNPNMAEGWRRYGQALLEANRSEEAVVALERVLFLTQRPTADVYRSLSEAYVQVGNLTMARDVLDEGLLTYPNEREYYTIMADTYLAEGDSKTADSWYVRMLQRWPYDAPTWTARGQIAQSEGRMSDAVAYFREAVNSQPNGVDYWMNLAAAAAMADDATLVEEATTRAAQLRPDDPGVWLQIGRYLRETNQTEKAQAAFERVLVLQPENLDAVAELTSILGEAAP